ncbi:MAG TPA: DUF441 domain-containing protein [Bacillota bacterium]|nr:DUF441 domain-containing protein [Bacillota bacterium]
MDALIILTAVFILGILSKNTAVWFAAGFLFFLRLFSTDAILNWASKYGINWGIAILTIGVLAPIATGKITLENLYNTLKSGFGILSIIIGIGVAYMGGRGTDLLRTQPQIVTGVLVGTIIGVAFFRGIPVGPLIAAGILALFSGFFK